MGLGRRQFIKLAGLALAGLTIDPLQAVVTNDNLYLNRHLGLMFNKPDGWNFIKVKNFENLKNEQILGNGFEEIKEEVWEEIGLPIIVITKFPDNDPGTKGIFSPTITLNITPKEELEHYNIESFEEQIELSVYSTSLLLRDFEITKRYDPYSISGCTFYEFDTTYSFEHKDIDKPLKVELNVLKAEHNGFYYDFNMHQSSAQKQTAVQEFKHFKNSIKLI